MRLLTRSVTGLALALALACQATPPEVARPRGEAAAAAPSPKPVPREPRLVPAETLVRSYSAIFGDLTVPEHRQTRPGSDRESRYLGWDQHLPALGLPDHSRDLARTAQTNTVMVAAFDRLAVELCDRAAVRDLLAKGPREASPELAALVQIEAPPVFDFAVPEGPLSEADFAPRFDVLHRTFLGYPARLAPRERGPEFYALYKRVEERHAAAKKGRPPHVPAWSAVCQGLARHPEFHHY